MASLTIKRRRVWYRIAPTESDGLTLDEESAVEIGGLARTDQAGYGSEFGSLVELAGEADRSAAHSAKELTT